MEVEKMGRWETMEFGSGTRRRPIGRDYAAAKDAECGRKGQMTEVGGKRKKVRRWEGGKMGLRLLEV